MESLPLPQRECPQTCCSRTVLLHVNICSMTPQVENCFLEIPSPFFMVLVPLLSFRISYGNLLNSRVGVCGAGGADGADLWSSCCSFLTGLRLLILLPGCIVLTSLFSCSPSTYSLIWVFEHSPKCYFPNRSALCLLSHLHSCSEIVPLDQFKVSILTDPVHTFLSSN